MKISELAPGTGKVDIEAEVVGVEAPREISKNGRTLKVANCTLRDDSGTITLVLWNENIDKISEGCTVQIANGYVNTWQDKPQLTLGKFGTITVKE